MEPKIMRQKEMKTVFGKRNYVILSIGSILVIIGYILMIGYLLNGFGIIYHPKQDHSKLSQ